MIQCQGTISEQFTSHSLTVNLSTATGGGGCTGSTSRDGGCRYRSASRLTLSWWSSHLTLTWHRQHPRPLVDLHIRSLTHSIHKKAMSGKGRIRIVHSPLHASQVQVLLLLPYYPFHGLPSLSPSPLPPSSSCLQGAPSLSLGHLHNDYYQV